MHHGVCVVTIGVCVGVIVGFGVGDGAVVRVGVGIPGANKIVYFESFDRGMIYKLGRVE